MAISFEKIKPGTRLLDIHRERRGNTTIFELSCFPVDSADEEVMSDKKICCDCKLPLPAHFTYTNVRGEPKHETTYACCQALKKALDAERERNALLRSDLLQLLAKHEP